MKTRNYILIFLLVLGTPMLQAQEVISSGGSHAQASGVSLAWTVGEVVTATFSGGGYILTQGFHQSRLSASAIDDILTPGIILAVYPNPSNYVLNLRVDEGDFSDLRYSLLSMDGKTLLSKQVKANLTEIDMLVYASGNYLLKVIKKSGDPVRTFRIVRQ